MSAFLSRNTLMIGGAAVVAVAIAAGGYAWLGHGAPHSGKTLTMAEADVCEMAVSRARDYGVLPSNAQKADIKTVDTNNPARVTCGAKTAEASFSLTADVACDDAKNADCLVLQKVTHENGAALFDTQSI